MTLETISQARAQLAATGFAEELVADHQELRAVTSATRYRPSELTVARLVRFQGITSPEEEAVLFALSTSDGQPLGTYAPPSGPSLSSDDAVIVARLHEQAIPEAEIHAHTRHDHIAAVFATRDTAQAAIDELRQLGFGSDRLGVAVREGTSRAFERDADAELVHDTETGFAAGAAIGFLAGMSIAAIALVPGGVIGLGGILAFGAAGGLSGAYFGAFFGESAGERASTEREELSSTRLEPGQVLVAVCSHGHPAAVQTILERHGGQLLLRPHST
ncbi:MAG: hypothetical protein WEB19_04575 [Acidimicrobiia bacterium]